MADFQWYIRRIADSIAGESDGGPLVTEREVAEIEAAHPEIPSGATALLAGLINERGEDGSLISGEDLSVYRAAFPQDADRLVGEMRRYCQWPASLTIFSPEAASSEKTCEDEIRRTVIYLRDELNFAGSDAEMIGQIKERAAHFEEDVGSLGRSFRSPEFAGFAKRMQEVYPPSKGFLSDRMPQVYDAFLDDFTYGWILDEDFITFARMLKAEYDMDPVKWADYAVRIFSDPRERRTLERPEAARLYRRLARTFHFEPNSPIRSFNILISESGPMIIDLMLGLSDLDARLTSIESAYTQLTGVYGGCAAVKDLSGLERLMEIVEKPGLLEKILSPDFAELLFILRDQYGHL